MLDIYPMDKNIRTISKPESILRAIIEQKINVPLIPVTKPGRSKIDSELIESVQETVHTSFLYSPRGKAANPDITIECHKPEIFDWIKAVADSTQDNQVTVPTLPSLKQSFLRISVESALGYL